MINVLSENKVAFDAAPLSSNSMRNKGWIEQWLSYVKNLGISLRLEVVKAIQTATVSLRVGGHIYITHKNSGAVICVPPDNDSDFISSKLQVGDPYDESEKDHVNYLKANMILLTFVLLQENVNKKPTKVYRRLSCLQAPMIL